MHTKHRLIKQKSHHSYATTIAGDIANLKTILSTVDEENQGKTNETVENT